MEQHIHPSVTGQKLNPWGGKLAFLGSIISTPRHQDAQGSWAQRGQQLPFLPLFSETISTGMWEEVLQLCFYLLKKGSSSSCILNGFLGPFINLTSRPANPEQ